MYRIPPVDLNKLLPEAKVALEHHCNLYHEPISAMQATLVHSLPAYIAYMQWYQLYEAVENILGKRLACIYAYSISKESDCIYCSVVFRKKIFDSGDNPDKLSLDENEIKIIDFGKAVAKCQGNIANHLFNAIGNTYSKEELVTMIAFAGQMIAANIFNNVVETAIDEHLQNYIPVAKSIWV